MNPFELWGKAQDIWNRFKPWGLFLGGAVAGVWVTVGLDYWLRPSH